MTTTLDTKSNAVAPRLQRLVDYYLECLKGDDGISVEVDLSETVGRCAPVLWSNDSAQLVDEAGERIVGAARTGDDVLLVCWPAETMQRRGALQVIPALVQEVLFGPDDKLVPCDDPPRLNPGWLRARGLDETDREELETSLGIAFDPDADGAAQGPTSTFFEACSQLAMRPDFANARLVGQITTSGTRMPSGPGIDDVVLLVRAEQSGFTKRLRGELNLLRGATEEQLARTALGTLLAEASSAHPPAAGVDDVLPVTPLSGNQAAATGRALTAPLSVVTGPPGTGKSQVVLNIVANELLAGRSVLVASKNNKAVDVVTARLNSLAHGVALARVGSRQGMVDPVAVVLEHVDRLLGMGSASEKPGALLAEAHQAGEDVTAAVGIVRAVIDAAREAEGLRAARDAELEPLPQEDADRIRGALEVPDVTSINEQVLPLRAYTDGISWWQKLFGGRAAAARLGADVSRLSASEVTALPPMPSPEVVADRLPAWVAWCQRVGDLTSKLDAERSLRSARASRDALPELSDAARAVDGARARHRSLSSRALVQRVATPPMDGAVRKQLALWKNAGQDILDRTARGRGYYERLRTQADAFEAVLKVLPAWCVTNQSVAGRIPLKPGQFDLVVIDEASQCDIASALPLLYRAKRLAVIGDAQQLRHIAKMRPADADRLIEQFGLDRDEAVMWRYDKRSLFDLAVAQSDTVVLDEHFRSHADIIGISNEVWYGGILQVHTDHAALCTVDGFDPGVIWRSVEGQAVRGPGGNSWRSAAEVDAVVDAIGELLAHGDAWTGTIGVVTPFAAHAAAIEAATRQRFGADLDDREFVCGTAHRLQGDERDVVVFAPCLQPGLSEGARSFLTRQSNLLNVAITRARAHLIVVGNREACGGSGIRALELLAAGRRAGHSPDAAAVGPGEAVLATALRAAGVETLPQHAIGPYRVDLAVVQDDSRIAIEIDGEGYHTDEWGQRLMSDLTRDTLLGQRGWTVLRFWHDDVTTDVDRCVAAVCTEIERPAPAEVGGGPT